MVESVKGRELADDVRGDSYRYKVSRVWQGSQGYKEND